MEPTDKTFEAQFATVVAQAMVEISRYGQEEFEKYKRIFNGYLRMMGPTYVYRTKWEEALIDQYTRSVL